MDKSADRIREELEHAIVSGEFADGERLDEVALAKRFKVSRTPVREALLALAISGLAEQLPRRGTFVRYPSFVKLIEMFEVMAELEAMCGQRAARHASEGDIRAIAEAAARCEEAEKAGDTDRYYRENEQFHHLIYAASGNEFLSEEAARLHKRLKPFRRLQLRVRNRMGQSMAEHRAIADALSKGDPAVASLLRQHVAIQGEKFADLMADYSRQARSRTAGRTPAEAAYS